MEVSVFTLTGRVAVDCVHKRFFFVFSDKLSGACTESENKRRKLEKEISILEKKEDQVSGGDLMCMRGCVGITLIVGFCRLIRLSSRWRRECVQ